MLTGISIAPLLIAHAAHAQESRMDKKETKAEKKEARAEKKDRAEDKDRADDKDARTDDKDRADDKDSRDDRNVNREHDSLPAVAANSPSGAFGDKGQLTVSSDAGLSIASTSISGVSGSTTTLTLRPAVDYFIAHDVSLGGFLGLDYTSAHGAHTTQFSIGPRVGYNLAFSERFSFWPKIGFSYSTTSASAPLNVAGLPPGAQISQTNSGSSLALNIFAPIMFHPVDHFFLGFGPALDTDLTGDVKSTTIAGRLTIGGWF
jgi:hypothetical protein